MDPIQIIALSMGAAWASGINLYATVAMLGLMGASGNIDLPPELAIVEDPLVIFVACAMYVVEFVADKVPGVDSAWDAIHTFIRIPAGAALAAAAVGDVSPAMQFAALLAGGTLAATTHATKAGTRLMINTSPEPFSNWAASIAEDFAAIGAVWLALYHPWIAVGALVVFVLLMIWLLPKLWTLIKALFRRIGRLFGSGKNDDDAAFDANSPTSDPDAPPAITVSKPD